VKQRMTIPAATPYDVSGKGRRILRWK